MSSFAIGRTGNRGFAVVLAVGVLAYVALLVHSVLGAHTDFGQPKLVTLALLTFLPVAAFFAFRFPLIFPFGAYLALVPFDSILANSSGSTLTKLIGILTGLALLARVILLREALRPEKSWFVWLAFVVYAGVSFFWTDDIETAHMVYQQIVQLFFFMTILAIYPARPTEFRFALAIMIAVGVGAALYALELFHAGSITAFEDRVVLATSSGVALDPNYFATSFLLPISVALATVFYSPSMRLRVLSGISVGVMMVGILVSGSRGGFVAAAAVFAYFVLRSRNRLQVGAIAVAALGLTAFFPTVLVRFFNDPSQSGSGSGRTFLWHTALATLHDHWLFGAGVGSFEHTYDLSVLKVFQPQFQGWGRPSHSIIVGSLTEFGVIGLALILWCWFSSYRQTRSIPRSSWLYGLRLASEAALVGLFIQALFIDPFVIKYYWLAYSFPLLIMNVARGATVVRE